MIVRMITGRDAELGARRHHRVTCYRRTADGLGRSPTVFNDRAECLFAANLRPFILLSPRFARSIPICCFFELIKWSLALMRLANLVSRGEVKDRGMQLWYRADIICMKHLLQ